MYKSIVVVVYTYSFYSLTQSDYFFKSSCLKRTYLALKSRKYII